MAAAQITSATQQLTYVVRAYPTRQQHAWFARCLSHTRQLYNAALEERIDCYKRLREKYGRDIPRGLGISWAGQNRSLTELRRDPEYAAYPRRMQCWALDQVEAAYKGMFTRHKQGARGKAIGFPKFRSALFWNTIGFNSPIDIKLRERGLYWRKAFGGTLRLRPHRDLPPWEDCTALKLCKDGRRWFAHLTYEVPAAAVKPTPARPVGVDIGLIYPVMRSDGVAPDMPRQSAEDSAAKRRASRALARCRKGSKRRRRVRAQLRRIENRIARRRRARQHVISARLTHHFDAVAVEDLNLRGLNRGGGHGAQGRGIRKAWRDRAPGALLDMLAWKATRDGRPFVRVDPRGTSINCSQCGARVPKRLRERTHCCTECGAVLDRDHNAALNVLARAGWGPGSAKPGVRVSRKSAASGAGLDLKHGSGAAGPRRDARKPRSPPSIAGQ
jgi:putative transposase